MVTVVLAGMCEALDNIVFTFSILAIVCLLTEYLSKPAEAEKPTQKGHYDAILEGYKMDTFFGMK